VLRKAAPKSQPAPALETLRTEEWGLEDFVGVCNTLLPRYLPDDAMDRRQREDVSVRLLRYSTSQGLLDEPARQGREARYRYRHLLQVLVMRRLMREGLGTKAIQDVMRRPDESLEALLHGGAQFEVTPTQYRIAQTPAVSIAAGVQARDEALGFLDGLRKRAGLSTSAAVDQPASAPAPAAPTPAREVKAKKEVAEHLERSRRDASIEDVSVRKLAEHATEHLESSDMAENQADQDTFHEAEAERAPPHPARWTRLEITPGLELHLSDQVRLPRTPAEREQLLGVIEHVLYDQTRRS
jgi:DNA-binding transcriptional MerR regulator